MWTTRVTKRDAGQSRSDSEEVEQGWKEIKRAAKIKVVAMECLAGAGCSSQCRADGPRDREGDVWAQAYRY